MCNQPSDTVLHNAEDKMATYLEAKCVPERSHRLDSKSAPQCCRRIRHPEAAPQTSACRHRLGFRSDPECESSCQGRPKQWDPPWTKEGSSLSCKCSIFLKKWKTKFKQTYSNKNICKTLLARLPVELVFTIKSKLHAVEAGDAVVWFGSRCAHVEEVRRIWSVTSVLCALSARSCHQEKQNSQTNSKFTTSTLFIHVVAYLFAIQNPQFLGSRFSTLVDHMYHQAMTPSHLGTKIISKI